MQQLSVAIITYNEEKNIERCLRSIHDIADDIVVVDSYSVDRTEAICRSFDKVRFFQNPFKGHIQQKNYALTLVLYPIVLSLDADESLSPELKASISEALKNWTHDGYKLNRLTNYCGQWIKHIWYPDSKLRLFDIRKGYWGGKNPHDQFQMFKGCHIGFLKGDLHHYSYYTIAQHVAQQNNYSDIASRSAYFEGITCRWYNLIINPVWSFFRNYILKGGFLDGWYGLTIARIISLSTFLKYIKHRDLQRTAIQETEPAICFFNSNRDWGGGEKWHFDVASRFHAKGYRVVVVTNKDSRLYQKLIQGDIEVYACEISNLSALNYGKVTRLKKFMQRKNVQTIILNLPTDLKAAGLAAWRARVKNIIYRRGSAIPVRNSPTNRFLYRHIVTQIIANSNQTLETILVNNPRLFPRERIKVIYNGIDLSRYPIDNTDPIIAREADELILGNAGRLVEQKGQKYLIELGSELKRRGYPFKILLAGDGPLYGELSAAVKQAGLQDNILFLGFLRDIRALMQTIDIFVLSSLWEGFGYVLAEAMACRRPVVAFDTSSNPEVIEHGVTGLLVDCYDIKKMADAVLQLWLDKDLLLRMGNKGRERVEKLFSVQRTVEEVEHLMFSPKQN